MANYPFLDEAKEYIIDKGPTLDDLQTELDEVVIRAETRVLEAIEDGKVASRSLEDDIQREDELFSYPVARMLVSCIADNFLIRRYALGEAERVSERLTSEETEVILVLGEELGIPGVLNNDTIFLSFIDYLENTTNLKGPSWKLVNQDLRDGQVLIKKSRYIRIIKENVMLNIIDELPVAVNDEILNVFSDYIENIQKRLESSRFKIESLDFGRVETNLFPPCMKYLLAQQKEGVNLSHDARFALTAFLNKVGLNEDGILQLFSESPDFRADLATYQIEHIIGEISGEGYTPPGCDWMKTNGICYDPDPLCNREWMGHPLTYYSVKKRGNRKEVDEDKDNP